MEIASSELQSLLNQSLEEEYSSGSNVLTTGYHVSLFYGLHLRKEVEISDSVKAVPLEQTEAFLDKRVVRNLVPPSAVRSRMEGFRRASRGSTEEAGTAFSGGPDGAATRSDRFVLRRRTGLRGTPLGVAACADGFHGDLSPLHASNGAASSRHTA